MFLTILVMLALIIILIGFNALYVAGEFAAVSARKSRVVQEANGGSRLAKMLLPVIEDHHRLDNYIAASQVGITLSSVVLGIFGQQQIAPRIEPYLADLSFVSEVAAAGVAATLILVVLTTCQVILGELVPKSLALQYPERVAYATAVPMRWSADIILRPLIIVLNGSGALLMRLMGIQSEGGHKHVHSPEEIKFLIQQSHEGGLIHAEEHHLLDSAFLFGELIAGEIVVPRTKLIAADVKNNVDEVLRIAGESDFSRIPIYENDIDHIIGFVHIKELFQLSYGKEKDKSLRTILRKPVYVPETIHLDNLWDTMTEEKSYVAIVFDEYGGTVGMITREDLLEELFGEVRDEFDVSETPPMREISHTEYRIRGDVSVTYVNDRIGLDLSPEVAYTIGGFFLNQLAEMPNVGDEVLINDVRLIAHKVEDKAVEEITLHIIQKTNPDLEDVEEMDEVE